MQRDLLELDVFLRISIDHGLWHLRSVSRAWDARLTAAAVAAQCRWRCAQAPSAKRAASLYFLQWYYSPGSYLCWRPRGARYFSNWQVLGASRHVETLCSSLRF